MTESATAGPPALDPERFHSGRPKDLRLAGPFHRFRHIVRILPLRLEALAGGLDLPRGGRVLDYGCAEMPYRQFFGSDVVFVGADLPGNPDAELELRPDGSVPVEDESFDAVLSTQVLEHVSDPTLYLSECHRVLRPGGELLLSTHGVMSYHPDPVDYWRWTCAGLRRAVEEAGLEVVRFEGIMGLAASGLQLIQDAWWGRVPGRLRPLMAFVVQSLIALADKFEPRESKDLNSLVFALVARRP